MIPTCALVIGLGITGESCLRFLHGKTDLFVTDTRFGKDSKITERFEDLELEYEHMRLLDPGSLADVCGPETVVYASPGIALHDPIFDVVRQCGSQVSCDIELFLDAIDVPAIGVTGTNGKSTTTDLVATMLNKQGFVAGGNIGVPALDLLAAHYAGYVLELSSFQLERMHPPALQSATILNITEDHIDHHRSFDAYAAAKHRIYERCEIAVFNNDDPITAPINKKHSIAVNGTNDWCVRDRDIVIAGVSIETDSLQLAGVSNHTNLVTAAALAHSCGGAAEELVNVAKSYNGLPHRMQTVAEINDIRYVNDSKATNVAATCAAIESFGRQQPNIVLLAGGDGKGAHFETLTTPLKSHVKTAVLYGRDANAIGSAVAGSTKLSYADSFDVAIEQAQHFAEPGDVVLLSPACASFDMFSGFEQRGDRFASLVRDLAP